MAEQYSEAAAVEIPMPHKDRSGGLMAFGIMTILLGCLCGLMVFFMVLGQVMMVRNPNMPPSNFSAIVPGMLTYVVLAVALVWLGIGSIQVRRWARALLLIFSWSWLLMGVLGMFFMIFFIPEMTAAMSAAQPPGQPAAPPVAMAAVMVFSCIIMGIFMVVLPAVWVFFYSSRHVKATCEARDPVTRWTDACPLPVLAISLWLLFSALTMLAMPLAGHPVLPFFGTFLTGMMGALMYWAIAGFWVFAAWLLYRLDVRGWWFVCVAMILMMVSSTLTYARHDPIEMYQLMGFPQAQIEQVQKMGLLSGNFMAWVTPLFLLPFLGYLIFVRKYFRREG